MLLLGGKNMDDNKGFPILCDQLNKQPQNYLKFCIYKFKSDRNGKPIYDLKLQEIVAPQKENFSEQDRYCFHPNDKNHIPLPLPMLCLVPAHIIQEDKKNAASEWKHINGIENLYFQVHEIPQEDIGSIIDTLPETDMYVKAGSYLYRRSDWEKPWSSEEQVLLQNEFSSKLCITYQGEYYAALNLPQTVELPSLVQTKKWVLYKLEQPPEQYQELKKALDILVKSPLTGVAFHQVNINRFRARIGSLEQLLDLFSAYNKEYKQNYINHLQEQAGKQFQQVTAQQQAQMEQKNQKLQFLTKQIKNKEEQLALLQEHLSPYMDKFESIKQLFVSKPYYLHCHFKDNTHAISDSSTDFLVLNKPVCIWKKDLPRLGTLLKATPCFYGFINIEPTHINSFAAFYQAGLKEAITIAHQHPKHLVYVVVNNYNIIFPNSWGEPLFNIFNGLTDLLPNETLPFPDNIRFLFIPFQGDPDSGEEIGLQFSYIKSDWVNQQPEE